MKLQDKKKKLAQKMIDGKVKSSQKGKASLERPKNEKNEGETMMLGKDEHNRV